MIRSLRLSAMCVLLATSGTLVPDAHAGAAPRLNSSQATVLVTSVIVLSVPLAVSVGLGKLSTAPFDASARHANAAKREKAQALPPMEVKQVLTTPEGERHVQLQVPDKPDQTATLQWPVREGDDPAAAFTVGQQVHFDTTPAGAGWTVKRADGQALAFVPTAYASGDALSETL